MRRIRVIPVILIDNGRAVITRQFGNSVYVGDPINAIKIFNDKEVDELIILDITSKSKRQEPDFELIGKLASESFMPIAYGGHIMHIGQAERIISSGVEKISFNTSLFNMPETVQEVSRRYGKQSVVASIDITRTMFGKLKIKTENSRKSVDLSIKECVNKLTGLGVGEIFLTSIDQDGMMKGYQYHVISEFKELINVPIIASGGAGSIDDFRKAIDAGASAVAAGAMFYFKGSFNSVLINYPDQKVLTEKLYNRI